MACINPDGTLSGAAREIMTAMQDLVTLDEVAQATLLPLYRIRSSVREIVEAGLVEEQDGKYTTTTAGRARVHEQTQ